MFSTPTIYRESKGLPVLEAWANSLPVVVPDHGTYPELINNVGGGLLCQPNSASDLAEKLAELFQNRSLARDMGLAGRQAVLENYNSHQMAINTKKLYESLL